MAFIPLSRPTRARFLASALLLVPACPAATQAPSSANPSRSFGPDACGPADPSYIRTAEESGGQPMFLQRSEAAKAFHLVRESTRNNIATVLWANGTLSGTTKSFEIPVDSVISRITFSFSSDTEGTQLALTQPSGGAVTASTSGNEITDLNCGRIVTVSTPQPGVWRAEITGAGRFWFQAQAQSDIHFISAEFVKEGGRIGHEGLFKIQGQPLAGFPATLEVSLSAQETQTTQFHLVTPAGDIIQDVRMHTVSPDPEFLELVGTVDLPRQPFRVTVTGRDRHGQPFQRVFPPLFHAETVEVSPQHIVEELAPGNTATFTFRIRNIGPAAPFKITLVDSRRFVAAFSPSEIPLGAGESAMLSAELVVPPGTASGTGDDLIVVAKSTAEPVTSNSAIVHLLVFSGAASPN